MAKQPAITTRVDATGKRHEQIAPGPLVTFTADTVKDPATHAQQMTTLMGQLTEVSRVHRSAPRLKATYFEGVAFLVANAQKTFNHGYAGAPVRWQVVRWYSNPPGTLSTGPSIFEVSQDTANGILVLQSVGVGIAEIEIWPR